MEKWQIEIQKNRAAKRRQDEQEDELNEAKKKALEKM